MVRISSASRTIQSTAATRISTSSSSFLSNHLNDSATNPSRHSYNSQSHSTIRNRSTIALTRPRSATPTPNFIISKRYYRNYIRTINISPPSSSSTSTSTSTSPQIRRGRIPLKSNSTHGESSTRGIRPTQEDTFSVSCLSLPHRELRESYQRSKSRIAKEAVREWEGEKLKGKLFNESKNAEGEGDEKSSFTVQEAEELAGQIAWFAVFDGHGGSKISKFLSSTLHQTFESVNPEMITDTVQYTRSHGGYFRRFNGGLLERWVVKDQLKALRGGRGSPMGREKNNLEGDGGFEKGIQDLVKGIERDPDGDGIHGRGEDAFKAEKLALENKEKEKEEKKLESSNGNDQLQENETSNHDTSSSTNSNANPGSTTTSSNTTTSPLPAIGPEAEKAKRDSKLESKKEEKELVEEARQVLQNLTKKIDVPKGMEDDSLTIAERATLACLVADRQIQADENLNVGGSTASVALLHSLDSPPQPWYSSKIISVTSVHIGDTRMLLCPVSDGSAIPLTNYHHPDDRSESERLRKMGAGMITDSFGEARWMGALANTRAFGDSKYKKLGVTAEPEIISQILKGDDHAFIIAFSDGIGGVLSDQEIVDLCRTAKHPQDATKAVLNFAEELGSDDNCTVLCIPLRGWGKIGGKDRTKEEREKRRSRVDVFRDNRQ